MLGPMGAHVISALRVMTPAEIDRYARTSSKKKVLSVAAGAEDFDLTNADTFPGEKRENPSDSKAMSEAEIIPIESLRGKGSQQERKGSEAAKTQARGDGKRLDKADDKPGSNSELESLGIYSSEKVSAYNKALDEEDKSKKESESVFLIKQRERLKKNSIKMMGKTALKTYCQTANAEIIHFEPDIDDLDQEPSNGSKGILINKKHY